MFWMDTPEMTMTMVGMHGIVEDVVDNEYFTLSQAEAANYPAVLVIHG